MKRGMNKYQEDWDYYLMKMKMIEIEFLNDMRHLQW